MIDLNAVYCPWCLTVMDVEYDYSFAPLFATCPQCEYEIAEEIHTLGRLLSGEVEGQEYNCVDLGKWTAFVRLAVHEAWREQR
jgi:hypothetical protein